MSGWKIDAFHGEAPGNQRQFGDELLGRVPANAQLIVVPKSGIQPAYRFLPKIDGGFIDALDTARYAVARLSADPPDFVLASGPPFYVFIAAYYVAKHFGVPLVLDYRDEWTECPFDFVNAGQQDRFWERRCLSAAAAVVFTTQSHLEHQLKVFPALRRDKSHLIPNGWVPEDFSKTDTDRLEKIRPELGLIRIAHVGNLAGHTPPYEFMAALEVLLSSSDEWRQRISVSFIGRRSPDAELILKCFRYQTNIEIIDHLSKVDANRKMQEADVLLLLSSHDLERYLPGKLFDYIAAQRPILVFGAPGEASRIVQKLGVGIFCSAGSGTELGCAISKLSKGEVVTNIDFLDEWLRNHQRDVLAKQMFEIISSLDKRA